MKIRSITCFYDPNRREAQSDLGRLTELVRSARSSFQSSGYEVQSTRLATTPFSSFKPPDRDLVRFVQQLEVSAIEHGFLHLAVGPATPERPDFIALVPRILEATKDTFCTGSLITRRNEISLLAVQACAEVIVRNAAITSDGFTNLRFAAIANVRPYCPFFPAGYAGGSQAAFSLAVEGADLATTAFSEAKNLSRAKKNLLDAIEKHARTLLRLCKDLTKNFQAKFMGFDFSLAPFPREYCSMAGALESLGVGAFGKAGSLAGAAFLASSLDEGRWKKVGFNGLMLPILEDEVLARRSSEGTLTLKDLLMYSAVCGVGLDTIPLPGDITSMQVAAILLDIASLASRLNKQLTARLMPVLGKKAGEPTEFHFEYFANGRVMEPYAQPLAGLLSGRESYKLRPR
jgi:uncharacterized protein (UPF0210 family)